jgi:hypothetical protein
MQGVKQDLVRDIECYTCGEYPSPLVLLRAPQLENWSTEVRRRGKESILVVAGNAMRHQEYPEGKYIATGAVAWFDRHARWIRTHSRVWVLGKPADGEGFDA